MVQKRRKMKAYITITSIFLLTLQLQAQRNLQQYECKQKIATPTETYHTIELSDEIYSHVQPKLHDLRIIGFTETGDTIEAPYILNQHKKEATQTKKSIPFNLLNQTKNSYGYYYTYEIPSEKPLSQIRLRFKDKNFEWKVRLEGSHNQKFWFDIIDDYRIVSIQNDLTNYSFTTLDFPKIKYKYVRLLIKSDEKPNLRSTKINETTNKKITDTNTKTYNIQAQEITEDPKTKQTIIELTLPQKVPISNIKIDVQDTLDYYRPIQIQYLSDSVQLVQGWKANYHYIHKSTLSSLEKNDFTFQNIFAKKLKIVVSNHDNRPLNFNSFIISGHPYYLTTRITDPAEYYLYAGNPKARRPRYDLTNFKRKIPENPRKLNLSKIIYTTPKATETASQNPLIENKYYLYFLMGIIILLLGTFTLKMLKKETE